MIIQLLGGVIGMLASMKLIKEEMITKARMKAIMVTKVSSDGTTRRGGGGPIINRKNSFLGNMHMADCMIALTRDIDNPKERFVKILKNRFDGHTGKADPERTINICARMIALSVFGDVSLKLFRVDLEEAIKKTITEKIGDAHDPFCRESTGDGT